MISFPTSAQGSMNLLVGRTLVPLQPSTGFGKVSLLIDREIREAVRKLAANTPAPTRAASLEDGLYDALSSYKIYTAQVAMYLDLDQRNKLFSQLDSLLDNQEWPQEDMIPSLLSYMTLLRLLLAIQPEKRPGLGSSSDGFFIAAWTNGDARLTVTCLPNDILQFVLSRDLDGHKERAAGVTTLTRLSKVLAPYNPSTWFSNAEQLRPTRARTLTVRPME